MARRSANQRPRRATPDQSDRRVNIAAALRNWRADDFRVEQVFSSGLRRRSRRECDRFRAPIKRGARDKQLSAANKAGKKLGVGRRVPTHGAVTECSSIK